MLLQAVLRSLRRADGCTGTPEWSYKLRALLLHVKAVSNNVRTDDPKSMCTHTESEFAYGITDYICLSVCENKWSFVIQHLTLLFCDKVDNGNDSFGCLCGD